MSLNGNNAYNIANALKSCTRKWSNMSPWDFLIGFYAPSKFHHITKHDTK
jgi:hypothetical protein